MRSRIPLLFLIGAVLGISSLLHGADGILKRECRLPSTRPICKWSVCDPSHITPQNPSGWLDVTKTGTLDVDAFLTRAEPLVKAVNAQGVIVWDIEGALFHGIDEFGKARMYLGSPDYAQVINPAVNYGRFFKKPRSDGLLVGVCIRPTEFSLSEARHKPSDDPYLTLCRKITYAHSVWGCRLFYVDSNYDGQDRLLPAIIFKRLMDKFPNCVIIPEAEDLAYHLWTVPYRELRRGETGTPTDVLSVIPNAVSIINCSGGNIREAASVLRANPANRILLVDMWWKNPAEFDEFLELSR